MKIVRKITGLTLAMAITLISASCSDDEILVDAGTQNDPEIVVSATDTDVSKTPDVESFESVNNETESAMQIEAEEPKETEKEKPNKTDAEKPDKTKGQISVYSPIDFNAVANIEQTYNSLVSRRQTYVDQMKDVLKSKDLYSEEEIAISIYNVVRIDSDLSSLILKIHKNKQKDIENMVYLADQIETLEKVLHDMNDLKHKIEESKANYSSSLVDIAKSDANQIEKVHKYALNPLNAPINKLIKQVEDLKLDLQNALANQP